MKKVFLIGIIILFLVAIPATVFLVAQRQELRKKAAPATTLTLAPATTARKVGDEFSLDVAIDTAENQVVAVEIHLTFDASILEALTITNGQLFPNVLASGIVEAGTVSITVGAQSATVPVSGAGTAATIRLKALKATTTPTSVRFAANTFAGALGEGATNVLVGTTPATVTIQGTGGSTSGSSGLPTSAPTPTTGIITTNITTPSPTPVKLATAAGSLEETAFEILSPADNAQASKQPLIKGTAAPGSTITVTIYSEPITGLATADANGNWTYTPPNSLAAGPHNIVASAQDPLTGATQTTTSTFIVAGAGGESATESGTPIAGNFTITLLVLLSGAVLLVSGMAIFVFVR
jgi:hypothetical protein